jgi:hypothetical protein
MFEGVVLAADDDFVRYQLEELVRERGRGVLDLFPRRFEQQMIARIEAESASRIEGIREEIERAREFERDFRSPTGVPAGTPWQPEEYATREREIADIERRTEEQLALRRTIARHLYAQARDLDTEIQTLLDRFSSRSETLLRTLLEESEHRVESEQIRYGIDRETHVSHSDGMGGGYVWHSYSMQESVSTHALAGAARDLAEKKERIADLVSQQRRLVRVVFNRQMGEVYQTISDQTEYDRLEEEITSARREYATAQASAVARYPILAALSEETGTRSLRRIAEGGRGRARTAGEIIYDRLENIRRVREGLEEGEVDPWTLPRIVTLTMAELGVRPGTMYARVIREEAEQRGEGDISDWILSGLALRFPLEEAV